MVVSNNTKSSYEIFELCLISVPLLIFMLMIRIVHLLLSFLKWILRLFGLLKIVSQSFLPFYVCTLDLNYKQKYRWGWTAEIHCQYKKWQGRWDQFLWKRRTELPERFFAIHITWIRNLYYRLKQLLVIYRKEFIFFIWFISAKNFWRLCVITLMTGINLWRSYSESQINVYIKVYFYQHIILLL